MAPPAASDGSPWAASGPAASLLEGGTPVTLVEGSCFALSGRTGDMVPHMPQGLFLLDVRVVSSWTLRIDGRPLEPLAVTQFSPHDATFVGRARRAGTHEEADILVLRRRHLGAGMRERLEITYHGIRRTQVEVVLTVAADLADVFAVKESRIQPAEPVSSTYGAAGLRFEQRRGGLVRTVLVDVSSPTHMQAGELSWRLDLGPRDRQEVCVEVSATFADHHIAPRFRCGQPDHLAEPRRRLARWQAGRPALETDHRQLAESVENAVRDLGALRIVEPAHPDDPVVAAGAPWFMTLFGRDSLLASWMSLIVDPTLAPGVLVTLARLQGTEVDPATEEQPGRILHEVRFEQTPSLALGGGSRYYGSVDATPLFVMLLGEVRRWGLADEMVRSLLPQADRALEWMETFGDPDGDGYVEYERLSPQGLINQGWKDSWDGINFADGQLATAPIALCEVQGYVYAAYLARAALAADVGDEAVHTRYLERAQALKAAFNRDFWLEDRGWFAVGLDADKRPIDALASNMGHCLWTGIVDDDKAPLVADWLLAPELFSGWGIRTLATGMARYNPISYHNGSVWPHDNALIAAGLMRYGFVDHAHWVINGLLDVAEAFNGRLPELFAGIGRDELNVPATYPASCSPQAWAAASPLLALRALLRFDPDVPQGRLHLAPVLLPGSERLRVGGVQVDKRRVDIGRIDGVLVAGGVGGLDLVEAPVPSTAPDFGL
ncbi:MAG: amylo-alpha,6-glucosidase [Acidimicrobiales bacterium]|nr:amylo-alpha,6-glucosidase [Acidimicrobiales bacterium]